MKGCEVKPEAPGNKKGTKWPIKIPKGRGIYHHHLSTEQKQGSGPEQAVSFRNDSHLFSKAKRFP